MPDVEELATEALRLLSLAGVSGQSGARDAAVSVAHAALTLAPDGWPRASEVALRCAETLRARSRWTMAAADLFAAQRLLEQALAIERRPDCRADLLAELARVLTRSATMLVTAADPAVPDVGRDAQVGFLLNQAERCAQRALAVSPATRAQRADRLHAAGLVLGARNQGDQAIATLREAATLVQPFVDGTYDLAQLLAGRHHVSGSPGDLVEARELLIALATNLRTSQPRHAFEAARFHGYWAIERGDWREAGEALDRALESRTAMRDSEDKDERQLNWLYETGAVASRAAYAWAQAGDARAAVAALERGHALEFAERLDSAAHAQATPILVANESLVYFAITEYGGAAIYVGGDRAEPSIIWLPAVSSSTLTTELLNYLGTYRDWETTDDAPSARRAWMQQLERTLSWIGDQVVGPILDSVSPQITALTVVPDGAISLLPLHAARVGDSWLLDLVSVRYASSAMTLSQLQRGTSQSVSDCLVVAEPSTPDAPPLPHAFTEGVIVRSLFRDGVLLSGSAATIDRVEAELGAHPVVHFAAHGAARLDSAMSSYVLLAGREELTLGRLLRLRLDGTRLVVLSACESAMQDVRVPEEKIGLPFGLMQAGASGVVASLWAVSDTSTLLLIVRFYENWITSAMEPMPALGRAQQWLRDASAGDIASWLAGHVVAVQALNPAAAAHLQSLTTSLAARPDARMYAHPYHWAAFAYYGA